MKRSLRSGIASMLLAGCLILTLAGCGEVTYEKLTEEQRAVIDFIYDKRDIWDQAGVNRVDVGASSLSTFQGQEYGTKTIYSYDASSDSFEEVDSSYIGISYYVATKHGLESGTVPKTWDHNWSESEKKDALAKKLYG